MAKNRNVQSDFNMPTGTIIGHGFTIEATRIVGTDAESMRVDGIVNGDIVIEGVLNLSETGRVEGNIQASSARVAGLVQGNINCRAVLHLAATAEIAGDILTDILIIDKGAIIHGRCQTQQSEVMPALAQDLV